MTTYSKETALFDTGAIATDIGEAAQTADRYITYVDADTGIQVHNAEDDDNYVQLNSDGMEVFQDDASVAMFGSEARIGPLSGAEKVVIGNGGISMYTADNAEYFKAYVDSTKTKIVKINYTPEPIPEVTKSGVGDLEAESVTYQIADLFPEGDWNGISVGEEFRIRFYVRFDVSATDDPNDHDLNGTFRAMSFTSDPLTKGTSYTDYATQNYKYAHVTYNARGEIMYNATNDTLTISASGTATPDSSYSSRYWRAKNRILAMVYSKEVHEPNLEIDGLLTTTDELVRQMDDINQQSAGPSSDIYKTVVESRDVGGRNMSYLGTNYYTNNDLACVLGLHRKVNNSDIYHTFGLSIDSSGNKYFDSPISTSVSGSTGALYFYRWGNIVYISSNGAFRSKSTSIASGTTLTQKIPNGFKPVVNAYVIAPPSASSNYRLECYSNGNIAFYGSSAWNGNMYISGMWMTADPLP